MSFLGALIMVADPGSRFTVEEVQGYRFPTNNQL